MRILVIHNQYREAGGEDQSTRAEVELLRRFGHEVRLLERSNREIDGYGWWQMIRLFYRSAWNEDAVQEVRQAVQDWKADIVHVHNFFPLFSPAIHIGAQQAGAATVQHLRNFRLICINGVLRCKGARCERCLGKSPVRGVIHRCYRHSFLASAAVAHMLQVHRCRRLWREAVDAFIVMGEHSRQIFVAGGIPADRLYVKPNFVDKRDQEEADITEGEGALYVGRLSEEKGVGILIEAWRHFDGWRGGDHSLTVIGDGPLRTALEQAARGLPVIFTGVLPLDQVMERMKKSRLVIVPSTCHETFGRTVVEAYACGRPVVATRLGNLPDIVADGITGFLVEPENAADLAEKTKRLLEDSALARRMGSAAHNEYRQRFTAEKNYHALMAIYQDALARLKILATPWRSILGIRVDGINAEPAVRKILDWAEKGESRYVCAATVHMIMEAFDDKAYRDVLHGADLVVPDGMPLAWMLKAEGLSRQRRVYGPDLTVALCQAAEQERIPVAFYGSSPETLQRLMENMRRRFPSLLIAHASSPPFSPTLDQDLSDVPELAASGARILFVGLGCPKQERWMARRKGHLPAVMVGVGAAFDFHAGTLRQAPPWVQQLGMEWFFRLLMEPTRLWKRYLKHNPRFMYYAFLQLTRLKRWLIHDPDPLSTTKQESSRCITK
ncbi:WecB/TagA/CpsF family glycosyltransferase [Heliobacterium undosum]|uniref:WecB/TagA/CpsF family glycosyltransferase n=1 Tax=Heliomicrobium undosum TaxID=121734 RepID=A0A845KY93_9FIRM|nr:WecB/TagA/CpsF family glycosyltransferase [Heliomicrobium undosum]MZP28777.1 WecB/TagA/CpsF family glycosyltransferase [Heliomicrobium undosum]